MSSNYHLLSARCFKSKKSKYSYYNLVPCGKNRKRVTKAYEA